MSFRQAIAVRGRCNSDSAVALDDQIAGKSGKKQDINIMGNRLALKA